MRPHDVAPRHDVCRRVAAGAILAAALLCMMAGREALARTVGVREIEVVSPERKSVLHTFVWYPAGANGRAVQIGENAVFRGTRGFQGAPIARGRFPLVLIAHGGLRAAPNIASWLAASLTADGFIAVVANPPPAPQGRAAQSILDELWLRPADLSAILTAVERDPVLAGQMDAGRVGAVGFFLGGNAVLALAGARIDAAAFMASCGAAAPARDCAWLAQRHVDLRRVDVGRLQRSNVDGRVRAAVVIDPELTDTLTDESLRAVAVPVRVVNLGQGSAIPRALVAAKLAARIPGSRYAAIPGATASSSFAECKQHGPALPRGEGRELALCDEGAGRTRAQDHATIAAVVASALRQAFAKAGSP